ncbi:CobW family GTP-binding protein [Phreatobacter sp.]|uniref:CobW family GTP-binding protein n=1 Tax=Phreatobacter sp. TaxID=1966341 RepID=UPI003F6EF276
MSLFDPDRSHERTPASLITGFLGAGKTTLLNRLLTHAGMANSLVIVNEFGTVGLDHLFIESRDTDLVLLSSGCICCTVRGDLEATLRDMAARRQSGDMPRFDRVLIETTGLADPAPIASLFLNNPMVMHDFRLQAIVTVVDAVNGLRQLAEQAESAVQVAVADRILVSKPDLADAPGLARLAARLEALAPGVPRTLAVMGEVDPAALFAAGHSPRAAALPMEPLPAHGPDCADPACAHPDHGSRHGARIRQIAIVHDRPLPWDRVNFWLRGLRATWGDGLLRLKGLVAIEEEPGPLVIHGVHTTFHPPVALAAWPDDDHRTRIVLILRDVDPQAVLESFHRVMAEAPAEG